MILPWRDVHVHPGFAPIPTSLTEAEIERLVELAEGEDVLEIGTAFGYATCWMAKVAKSVTTVDPHKDIPGTLEALHRNLITCGVQDKVTVLVESSLDFLAQLADLGTSDIRFGLIFVDGDHSAAAVARDAKSAYLLARPDGVICFHDYGEESCPGVKEALDDVLPGDPDRLTDTLFEKAVVNIRP
jgi:predicted O-methyltransferase YrrM